MVRPQTPGFSPGIVARRIFRARDSYVVVDLIGTTLGRIRIESLLGQGGMGRVYAGYDEALRRPVALKAIDDERRFDAEAKARFLREARVLSRLDHPSICRIYELLEGEQGNFLVLELIPGRSLKQAMAEDDLHPSFELHIAERINDALAAAHAQGVAHRDLKPENVMLTPEGEVKVLDFGLAYDVSGSRAADDAVSPASSAALRLVSDEGTEAAAPLSATILWRDEPSCVASTTTRTGDGDACSATTFEASQAADSLKDSDFVETEHGIVMGTVAYMSPEQARGERVTEASDMYSFGLLLQELFTGESPYPSGLGMLQMLRCAGTGKTKPVTGLDPDVTDLIQRLKSIAPAARPSAVETAERLRWLRGKPGRQMLRRVVAAILVVLALATMKYTLDLRHERALAQAASRQTEAALHETEDVLEFVVGLFTVADPATARGREITARELLDAGARQISTELGHRPRSQSRLMLTMGRVYRQLGLFAESESLVEDGLTIRGELEDGDDLETAAGLDLLANLHHDRGSYDEAQKLYARALTIRVRLLGEENRPVAASLVNLAGLHHDAGEEDLAEPLLLRALDMQKRLLGEEHRDVALALNNLGDLYRARGEAERAAPYLEEALAVLQKCLAPDHPKLAVSLNNLAMTYFELGRDSDAEPLLQRAVEIQRKVLGDQHPDVATGLNNLAELLRTSGEYERAETLYWQAVGIYESALGETHPNVAVTLSNLADSYRARGEARRAEALYERALEIQRLTLGAAHPGLAVTLNHLADLYAAEGRSERAESLFKQALAIQEQALGHEHPSVAITLADLGALYADRGHTADAERLYLRSLAATRRSLAEDPDSRHGRHRLATTHLGLGRLYQMAGAPRRATESLHRAVEIMEPLTARSQQVAFLHTHALALLYLDRVEAARPLASTLLEKGWRDRELLALCEENGLLASPTVQSAA